MLVTFALEVILSDEKCENEWLLQAPVLFLEFITVVGFKIKEKLPSLCLKPVVQ